VRVVVTVVGEGDPGHDVVLDVDPGALVRDLRVALGGAGPLWVGAERLPDDVPVSATALRDGSVVAIGRPVAGTASPTEGRQLRVVGGPYGGLVHPLPDGASVVGRSATLVVADPSASRRHCRLTVGAGGVTVEDLGSTNGTAVDGVPVEGPVRLPPEGLLALGSTRLAVGTAGPPDAAVVPDRNGGLAFNRPPRLLPAAVDVRVELPEPPEPVEPRPLPWAALVVPVVLGAGMALVLHRAVYALFAVLGPVLMLSSAVTDRRHVRRTAARRRSAYDDALAEARAAIGRAVSAEELQRRDEHPDPAAALLTAIGPRRRLWERRRGDDDALVVRLGLADRPARVRLDRTGRAGTDSRSALDAPVVHEVPVTVSLREVGVLGVAGPPAEARRTARWLVAQAAVLTSPRDLSVVVLTDEQAAADWSWLRWLPHARPGAGQDAQVLLGSDAATTAVRVAELTAQVAARTAALDRAGVGSAGPASLPAVLLVLDGARALRRLQGIAALLRDGPAVGLYAACLDAQERLLPEECSAALVLGDDDRAVLRRTGADDVLDLLLDGVSADWCDRVGRALSPLRDVEPASGDGGLPDAARLLDLLDLDPPTAPALAARWAAGGTTRVVLGAGPDGPLSVDLRTDGPHGLVAGTTGSGKSELLQTVVASLAAANPPDAVIFVLVDYKGGSAFGACAALPHTVGLVTDLDGHLVERALASLSAELRLRERRLAEAGVADVDTYVAARRRNPCLPALPRLVVVVDEFAALARELPEFVRGLVDVAQRGRSLGLHLLLATQRPSGVVSPEIRANTALRIALRVTDAAESLDVLDATDAARIDVATPGRACVRLASSGLVAFQAGRVGGRGAAVPGRLPAPVVHPLTWTDLGRPVPRPTRRSDADDGTTDLSALVGAAKDAAALLGLARPRRPWLPPLPDVLLLDTLLPDTLLPGTLPLDDPLAFPYGLTDLPAEQAQRPAVLDLSRDGHLFIAGSPGSGRSQLLRTLAGAIARGASPDDVHLYGLDCGNGALLAVAELPHCGAVVGRGEPERAARLLGRLTAEVDRRQALLAAHGHGSVDEQRRTAGPGEALPHIVLLLDRWEGFTAALGEADGGRLSEVVLALLREGAQVGMHLVVTGDRSLLGGRLAAATEHRICLPLADRSDVALLGLDPRRLPARQGPGRAVRAGPGGAAVELQVALLDDDPSGQAQAAALARLGHGAARGRGPRPFRVDVLPSQVGYGRAARLRAGPARPLAGLLGVGGDELTAVGPDLARVPSFLVAGPRGSGRSTALLALARSLLDGGTVVALATPRPSPLRMLSGPGVVALWTGGDLAEADLAGALDLAGDRPVAVVVDDADLLRDCAAGPALLALVKGERAGRVAVVLAGSADDVATGWSGWQVEARKARYGALLSPQALSDGDLLGVRLPRSLVGGPVLPGRALVHLGDGTLRTVQVPLPDEPGGQGR
jgi:DNA segregation ATPase FtsK/SpoIIIE, S-DNA-T family